MAKSADFLCASGNQNRNVPVNIHWHIWLVMVHLMLTSDSVSDNDDVMINDSDDIVIVRGTDLWLCTWGWCFCPPPTEAASRLGWRWEDRPAPERPETEQSGSASSSLASTATHTTHQHTSPTPTHTLYTTGCFKTSCKLRKHITETLYGVFFVFLGSYDCQIWAIFHFGTLWAYGWKKSWKIWPWKKARFQGWLKLANFLIS